MAEYKPPTVEDYIKSLVRSNEATEKAIRGAIRELGLFDGAKVLDLPCGIGNHTIWMVEENVGVEVLGADFAAEHLEYAERLSEQKGVSGRTVFDNCDINNIQYSDDSFDFIWCCDGLWPGPAELGCLAVEPYDILEEMARITKNDGTIAVLFWSGHKLLAGYPLLESALNSTLSANRPVTHETNPDLHYMNTILWLEKTGLKNIKSRTFATDINGPLDDKEIESMLGFTSMFWGAAEAEVSPDLWKQYRKISDPTSVDFIFNKTSYAGFITYTMFTGEVVK